MGGSFHEEKLDKYKSTGTKNCGNKGGGKTRRETADELGLKKIEIKNWINRHNKETAREEAGLLPKGRGVSLSIILTNFTDIAVQSCDRILLYHLSPTAGPCFYNG